MALGLVLFSLWKEDIPGNATVTQNKPFSLLGSCGSINARATAV
jgi:hypothetical protein